MMKTVLFIYKQTTVFGDNMETMEHITNRGSCGWDDSYCEDP